VKTEVIISGEKLHQEDGMKAITKRRRNKKFLAPEVYFVTDFCLHLEFLSCEDEVSCLFSSVTSSVSVSLT
jgi:hypothetical protein